MWLQLVIGWIPVWALYSLLILTAHPRTTLHSAAFAGIQAVVLAALLGLVVQRLTTKLEWPYPMRLRFLAIHAAGAVVYAAAWIGLITVVGPLIRTGPPAVVPYAATGYLVLGIWFYVMVAGISYAAHAAERAVRAESLAARAQLATLRAQLNPHFMFNALHTVVQLIPRDPARASAAAEQVAGLLRTTLEEDRDLVPLADELAFVERYLAIERIRFDARLDVRIDLPDDAKATMIPSFALQTLVENAVRHGAGPRVEPTIVEITGRIVADHLTVTVSDTGAGATPEQVDRSSGTGLARLKDRLAVLYRGQARLELSTTPGGGFTASLSIPKDPDE